MNLHVLQYTWNCVYKYNEGFGETALIHKLVWPFAKTQINLGIHQDKSDMSKLRP